MDITKERTRIIFAAYSDQEKRAIDNMVATMDNVFTYEDEDNRKIYLPTGMMEETKQLFPKHKIEDKSSTYWDFAHITPVHHNAEPRNQLQIDFIKFILEQANVKQKLAGILSPGTGKGQPLHTLIPTPNGPRRMGDLKIGDKIFGSNGKQITVTEIYDRGVQDIYKVTFNDGRYTLCDSEHLWNVMYYWTSNQKTIALKDMIEDYKIYRPHIAEANIKNGDNRDPYEYRYRIPILSSPVQYDYKSVSIDPYVLGAFIGNGCLTEHALSLSSGNDFVPKKIAQICGFITKPNSSKNYTYAFYDAKTLKRIHTREFFKSIPGFINTYSRDRIIPNEYMYNDISIRMELLRGLMDTDGCIRSTDGLRYHMSYSSCSIKLLKQIKEIIQSIGFDASIMSDKRENKYKNGYHGELLIRVPQSLKKEFFSLPSKLYQAQKAASIPDRNQPFKYLIIKDIQLIKREESRCIRVDALDQLYLTQDFIVTHNTFMACYAAIKIGLRTLIIVPTTGIKNQWAETLTGMFKVPADKVITVNNPRDFINVKGDFVVVSQASLAALNKTYDLEKIMKVNKFGIKVIDEVQMWFHNIIKIDGSCNIANNWYLTGTFGRSADDQNALYQKMFGDLKIFRELDKKPTLFDRKPGNVYGMKPHMNVKMIWTHSGLTPEEIKKVTSSMRYSEREGKWMRFGISIPAYTQLVIPKDGRMTKFLSKLLATIKMANKEVTYGKMLVLVPTISSVEVVAKYLKEMYPNLKIGTIHSKNSKQFNDNAKAESDIMVSTVKSSGTGFDVKDLSKLVVGEQFKSWILADQVSGRLRRRPDGQDTYMWDVVDADIKQLRAWGNVRAGILKKKSKSFKVVEL
jgi:superfamily II DNA or RNA helicase